MFEKMRRFRQELPRAEVEKILQRGTSGVLSVIDTDGYPYSVPLSYVHSNGKIYFHSAKSGHKLDAIKNCKKATFCIIDKDDVQPEKFTTFYKSVIAFGTVEIIEDEAESLNAITKLGEKYSSGCRGLQQEIEKHKGAFAIIAFSIEHITGKQAIELV